MAAPKIDPFGDGEALDLTAEVAEQESAASAETQQVESAEPVQQPVEKPALLADGTPEDKPVSFTRLKEVIEERTAAERKAAEIAKERDELKEKWARMDERAAQLREANQFAAQQAAAAQKAAERPDPTYDPTGAELYDLKQKTTQIEQAYQALQGQFSQAYQGVQQTQQQQEFNNWVQYQAQSYAQTDPHYFEKAQHAVEWRVEVWKGMGMNEQAARERVAQEAMLLAAEARQNGVNFAPMVARLAEQVGWQAPQQNGQPARNGNGQVAPSQKIQQLQAGQKLQGLGHLPGNTGENQGSYRTYTPAQIAEMSEGEFARVMSNPKLKADLQYAMAMAEGVDPNHMGRI